LSAPGRHTARPPVIIFLLLASVSASLLLRAWLTPPRGTAFVGTFAYVDDFYNYLSMVEQAQRGALVFQSKMASPAQSPALVNVEWLSVGWIAAALGGRPVLAYRLFGLAALAVLVWVADRWVVRCGVPQERRAAALLLVLTGGGLGGLCHWLGFLPVERAFDLRTGAFPFVEVLANPHFTAGTALLASALGAFASGRAALGALLGATLGLVRPYDAALLGAVEFAAVLLLGPGRDRLRRALPIVALVPPLAYNEWVFRASPAFRAWVSPHYAEIIPSALEWLVLLGPATLAACTSLIARGVQAEEQARRHVVRLRLWAAIALLIALLRPVPFSLQFVVGIGLPLLVLAAVGLARWRHALEVAVPLLATSSVVYAWLAATPNQDSHAPVERIRVASALRAACRPGDLALAPADIGLYVGGLTPCWPYVSHPAAPDYTQRVEEVTRFYGPASTPARRAALLDRACIAHVVVPPALGVAWFDERSAYRPRLAVDGPNGSLAVWSRAPSAACRASP
jgi:hypothetical protein